MNYQLGKSQHKHERHIYISLHNLQFGDPNFKTDSY